MQVQQMLPNNDFESRNLRCCSDDSVCSGSLSLSHKLNLLEIRLVTCTFVSRRGLADQEIYLEMNNLYQQLLTHQATRAVFNARKVWDTVATQQPILFAVCAIKKLGGILGRVAIFSQLNTSKLESQLKHRGPPPFSNS